MESVDQFIYKHLLSMGVTFSGAKKDIEYIDNNNKFLAILKLLGEVEKQIKENIVEYRGTEEFKPENVSKVFTNKKIKVNKESERANGQEDFLSSRPWYVFNANYGTQEEKDFVEFMDRQIEELQKTKGPADLDLPGLVLGRFPYGDHVETGIDLGFRLTLDVRFEYRLDHRGRFQQLAKHRFRSPGSH